MMNFFPSPAGKRRDTRYKYSMLLHYRARDREPVWNYAHSLDISARGVRLVVNSRIENNAVLVLKFTLPGEDTPIEISGSAVWKKSLDGRRGIQCGVEFDESSCRHDLERFRLFLQAKFGTPLLQTA